MLMNKIELKLRFYPEVILRKKASWVKEINETVRQILNQMVSVMYNHKGVGLAGNQVGLDYALLVADDGNKLYKLINPKIIWCRGKQVMEEGCLSLPGICVKVKRAKRIKVSALDENARPIIIETEGLLSQILQHEIDHLNGRLIIDYVPIFKRFFLKRQLTQFKKLQKERSHEGMCK